MTEQEFTNEPINDEDELPAVNDECPIRPCRWNEKTQTALRGIRTNRLLCTYCAVSTPVGYIAREVARETDNRFYKGTNTDYVIVLAITAGLSLVINALAWVIGGFFLPIIIGGAAGGFVGTVARRATGRRVGRYSPQVAIGGLILGAIFAPSVAFFLRSGLFIFRPELVVSLPIIICTAVMGVAVWSIFQRRI